ALTGDTKTEEFPPDRREPRSPVVQPAPNRTSALPCSSVPCFRAFEATSRDQALNRRLEESPAAKVFSICLALLVSWFNSQLCEPLPQFANSAKNPRFHPGFAYSQRFRNFRIRSLFNQS